MRKKLVILLLTVVCVCLALGISACDLLGSNSDGSDTNSSDSSTDYGSSDGTNTGDDSSSGNDNSDDNNPDGTGSGDDGSGDDSSGGSTSSGDDTTHIHTAGEAVIENEIAATCVESGSYDSVVYCTTCGEEISRETITIEATGVHNYNGGITCTVCGYTIDQSLGLEYTLSNDGNSYTVSGIGDCSDTGIVIPSTYNNLPVKSIAEGAFEGQTQITSLYVPDSVVYIGSGAFSGCSSLVSITLPFVGSSASATSASSSTLFGYIFGINSYTGGTETEQYYTSGSNKTYYIPATLTTVTITDGDIFYGAFYNCTKLASVTIPDSVTSIGNYSFYNCSSLTSVTV